MRDTRPIILFIVLILLFGGSFYLVEETVKSHLSYVEANFRNSRENRLYKQSKRIRSANDNQGHQQQAIVDARLLNSADD